MIENVLSVLKNAIQACFTWVTNLISATGTEGLIIGTFAMIAMTRLLIVPLLGQQLDFSGSSDRAKPIKNKPSANSSRSNGQSGGQSNGQEG